MTKVWRVARTEYLNIIRTKAFVLSIVLMPVLMGGAVALQVLLEDKVDASDRRVAVIDRTRRLVPALAAAAQARNRDAFDAAGEQTKARFLVERVEDDPARLARRARDGDLFAYIVIDEGVIEGAPGAEIAYHSRTPTYRDLPGWIRATLDAEIRRLRFEEAGISQEVVARLSAPARFGAYGIAEVTGTGAVKKAERVDELATFGVPAAAMVLLFMLVMMATPALLNNVLEEKMQRIVEILVSSVSPFELFLGKLLGNVFVSWTLSVLYLGGALYVAHSFGVLERIPLRILPWFLFFQLLALLIYGSLFSGIGATCSEMRDAQSMMMPATLLLVFPMFVWTLVLKSPDSAFAIGVSLFPPATPFLMLVRLAVPPGPAVWEIALAVVLTIAFTLGCVWAAGRVFRIGILMQGQPPSLRKIAGWVFSRT